VAGHRGVGHGELGRVAGGGLFPVERAVRGQFDASGEGEQGVRVVDLDRVEDRDGEGVAAGEVDQRGQNGPAVLFGPVNDVEVVAEHPRESAPGAVVGVEGG